MNKLINRLNINEADFAERLTKLLAWEDITNPGDIDTVVSDIISAVRSEGDAAILRYTSNFDSLSVASVKELQIDKTDLQAATKSLPGEQHDALTIAASRIRAFHEHQKGESWSYTEDNGNTLGQLLRPLQRVGIYVPGGKACYPSSVLMNAIPAQVAGVNDIVMVSPTPAGEINQLVLAAADIAGVSHFFRIGGAQAIAALAYGTETIPRVDKIVGPGNIYVATAKRKVFGQVGLDMVAGPSEILIVCDGKTNPDWIAMDLFSQAEHDELAQAILISPDAQFIDKVHLSLEAMLPTMERHNIIKQSLSNRGMLIKVESMEQALELVNRIAPEHLELSVDDPEQMLPAIQHAGAIFMGRHTPEALGDYCAGPNHVLPTSGTPRFSSPLGVYDFQKRSSIIHCSPQGASTLAKTAAVLAKAESLTAHARSAEYRFVDKRE